MQWLPVVCIHTNKCTAKISFGHVRSCSCHKASDQWFFQARCCPYSYIRAYIFLYVYIYIYLYKYVHVSFSSVCYSHTLMIMSFFAWVKQKGIFVGNVSNILMVNVSNRETDFSVYFLVIIKNRRLFKYVFCSLECDVYLQLKKHNFGSLSICLLIYASVFL